MATHVGVLDEGKLVQFGTPREIYENPNSVYVASRLGLPRINTLPAGLVDATPASATTIGLRPEHIVINASSTNESLTGQVVRIEPLGDQTRLHLHVADQALVTLVEPHSGLHAGDSVSVSLRNPLYFNEQGARVR